MRLTIEQKDAIKKEYKEFEDLMYAGKSLEERQELGQFFTPPEITIKMIEEFDSFVEDDTLLDPCMGAAGLLTACIVAGLVKPTNVFGIELDWDIYKIAKTRLLKLGVPESHFYERAPYDTTSSALSVEQAKTKFFTESALTTRRPEKGKHFFCGNALNKNSYKFTDDDDNEDNQVTELGDGTPTINWGL